MTNEHKSSSDDYYFHYKIDNASGKDGGKRFSRIDLLIEHLENVLNMAILCSDDKEVNINSLKLLNDRTVKHTLFTDSNSSNTNFEMNDALFDSLKASDCNSPNKNSEAKYSYQSIKNASFYEPTIEYIKKQLESILKLIDLEVNGEVVNVDGFRIKDLSKWVEESACNPADMLEYLATRCNCNCVFCYNRGSPQSLALARPSRTSEEELEEIRTRLKYFSPAGNKSLFTSLGLCYESFIHPNFMEVLKDVRKKTDKLIRIATNGATLTGEVINYLSEMKPMHLDIALHSSNQERRKKLMCCASPEIAIKSLPLLKNAGIVYDIVIVPWPLESPDEMIDDMIKTIDYAVENDVHLVQISLPGFTQYFSEKKPFNHDFVWKLITDKVIDIRNYYNVPIVIRPSMLEEYLFQDRIDRMNLPELIGIVKGSPAYCSGLKKGDILTKIGSNAILNRPQARNLLSILQKSGMDSITVEVDRNGERIEKPVNFKTFSYPYSKDVDSHLGIVFIGTGLRSDYLETIQHIIREKEAKNILFLSSVLVKPLLEQNIRKSHYLKDQFIEIKIGVPENRYFGGNICMGDLLVVQDYIDYIKEYLSSEHDIPDLIIIPSSPFNLSGWGRDLTGRVYMDIERETGIPVEILDCHTIYD